MSRATLAIPLPTDREARRRLWREWIANDAPVVERERARPGPDARRSIPMRVAVAVSAPDNPPRAADDDWLAASLSPAAPGVIDGLRAAIAGSLVDGQLRLGDRQRLARRAARLGLTRFEASLLIAAVQHRAGSRGQRAGPRDGAGRAVSVAPLICAALAFEAAVIAIACAAL